MDKGRPGKSDAILTFIWRSFHSEFSYILSTYLRLLLENTTNDVPVAVKNQELNLGRELSIKTYAIIKYMAVVGLTKQSYLRMNSLWRG